MKINDIAIIVEYLDRDVLRSSWSWHG